MPKPDYRHWLTKQQAADALACSTKTIESLAKAKQLHQVEWQRPETGAHVRMFHPADVERLRKERNPNAEAFPVPDQGPVAEQSMALVAPAPMEQLVRMLAGLAGNSQTSEKRSDVRLSEKLFLSIPEAAEIAGLPQMHLRRLVAGGKLQALKTGRGWRIRRKNLLEDI